MFRDLSKQRHKLVLGIVRAEVAAQTERWNQCPIAAHKMPSSDLPIATLALVPEHTTVVVVSATDVDGIVVADAAGDIVPFGAADSLADIDHGLAQGLPLHTYQIL